MKSYSRMLVLLFGIIGTAMVLQGAFDSSDHNKASRAVRGYRVIGSSSGNASGSASGSSSIEERLAQVAPGGTWSTEITHGCRGIVRVQYRAPRGDYVFDYDVPGHGIHPGNPAAEKILESLPPAPAAPASPSPASK